MRIALTGGIACGKSLLAEYLRAEGVETVDADDIVHGIIPADERRRLAAEVFADPAKRRALEARIHPLVREALAARAAEPRSVPLVEIVPLLFEVHWEADYDIITAVFSPRSVQIERMMRTRGYTREQADARLSAQISSEEKAERSGYVVYNDSTQEHLQEEAVRFAAWLKERTHG